MFNLLLLVGAISPINGVEYPDGYDPSYFVENVPVLRDATSPDWTVLNTEFIYDPNAQPYDDEINSSIAILLPEEPNQLQEVASSSISLFPCWRVFIAHLFVDECRE